MSDAELQESLRTYDAALVSSVSRTLATLRRIGQDHKHLALPTFAMGSTYLGASLNELRDFAPTMVYEIHGHRGWTKQAAVLSAIRAAQTIPDLRITDTNWIELQEAWSLHCAYVRCKDLTLMYSPNRVRNTIAHMEESIRIEGVRSPLVISIEPHRIVVIDGEVRLRAARRIGLHAVPTTIVVHLSDIRG